MIILIILILLIPSFAGADVTLPYDNFVEGWQKSERLRTFIDVDLFNYINGGAELFKEFGFDKLLVQSYANGDEEIVVEVYQMENPEAAFGIYLMKCGKETPMQSISARNTGNRLQFTILKNKNFIQINNFTGNEKNIPVMSEAARALLRLIPEGKSVTLLEELPKTGLIAGSELLIRGQFALQPIYTFGDGDILQLNGKVFGVVGDYKTGEKNTYTFLKIQYADSSTAAEVFQNLLENLDPYLIIQQKWDGGFIFKDYQDKYGIIELKEAALAIKIHLVKIPISNFNIGE